MHWRAATCALVCAAVFSLSACTFADSNANNGKAAPPGAAAAQAAAGPTPMDAFRSLAPPEGMKFTPLFSAPAGSDDARFDRLEQAVQSLRNDFDTVTPTLVRLAAIEKDIRELVGELRTITDGGPIVEAVPATPVEAAVIPGTVLASPAPAPKAAPAPAAPPPQSQPAPAPAQPIPGEDIAGGTEAEAARSAAPVPTAPSSPVTPEAASTGQLPPDGAASPVSPKAAPAPSAPAPAAAAPAPAPLPEEPLPLSPVQSAPAVAPEEAAAPALAPPAPLATEAAMPEAAAATPAIEGAAAPRVAMGQIMGDIRDIRIGDHIDKTRIVLDATVKAPYKASLSADGRRLFIELPQYAWKAAPAWSARTATLVSGYRYADGLLTLDLLAPASLRAQSSLPAASGTGERIVIDLFSALVHVE
jgi:hypothetical protein